MGEVEAIAACIDRHVVRVLYCVGELERPAVLAKDARRHEFAADADLGHVLRGGRHALAQFGCALALDCVERVAAFEAVSASIRAALSTRSPLRIAPAGRRAACAVSLVIISIPIPREPW